MFSSLSSFLRLFEHFDSSDQIDVCDMTSQAEIKFNMIINNLTFPVL